MSEAQTGKGAAVANTEIELKLLVHPRHVNRLKRHPLLRQTKEGRRFVNKHLRSIYFDTPKMQLGNDGVALRLRKNGHDGWEQTVKSAAKNGTALPERTEINVVVPTDQLDLDRFEGQTLPAPLNDEKLAKKVDRLFETIVNRSQVDLVYRGAIIELALDSGEIKAGDKSEPIEEMELELKHGNPLALFDLALDLQTEVPMRLFTKSKASRGKALFLNEKATYAKAKDSGIKPGVPAESAFRAMLGQGLIQVLENEQCVAEDLHIEGTHQMRVALRRLRTCFNLYKGLIPAGEADELTTMLRWLTKSLDDLRDWDVFLDETLPPLEKFDDGNQGLAAVRRAAERHRAEALTVATTALADPRYERLGLLLGAWSSHTRWANGASPEQMAAMLAPVEEVARYQLSATYKRVVRTGKKIETLTIPELHAWRLKVKRLRYACDFFGQVFEGKAVQKFRQGMAGIQDVLGKLNDAEVARIRMLSLTDDLDDQGLYATGLIAGWHANAAQQRLGGVIEAWRTFEKQKPFWEK